VDWAALLFIAVLRAVEPKWFLDSAHGWATISFFVFLWLAILANVAGHRRESDLWDEGDGFMWWGRFRNVFHGAPPTHGRGATAGWHF
jgi:hypothetical protein